MAHFCLGRIEQALDIDFDRLRNLADEHRSLRQMLGHTDYMDEMEYQLQTVIDNVSLLSEDVLREINAVVVRCGDEWLNHQPEDSREGRVDSDMIVPFAEQAQRCCPTLDSLSTDRGYWSPRNRAKLDKMLRVNVLPKKGGKPKADQVRESAPDFAQARRQHPAIESAINNLNHRGLKRVRTHGAEGFVRSVALGVMAANVHRLGQIVKAQRRQCEARHLTSRKAA